VIGAMITGVGRPRQQSCKCGHLFTPANVRHGRDGRQECCACARRRDRDWKRQHRAHLPIVDDKPATVALVVWGADLRASWSFHRSHADAAAHAPTDAPFTVVDIARKPWISHHTIGKGTKMSPKELLRLQAAAFADNDRPMRRHPAGLVGRCADALDDLALLEADPHASPQAKQSARALAAALSAALAAED